MEDARTTRIDTRSLMEDARMMMEDAWMTVETAGILMMANEEKLASNNMAMQDSLYSIFS